MENNRGFTLIELMVAMVIAGIVMAAIVATYRNQMRTHLTQQSIVDMHQTARAALHLMKSEIQMAGYDPIGSADATVLTATSNEFRFQIDADGDGAIAGGNEDIRYALNGTKLGRETGGAGGLQPVAENVDALQFIYFDENLTRFTPTAGNQSELDRVRMVLVTIVARADDPVMAFKQVNNQTYTNSLGETVLAAVNDTSRRVLSSTSIWCRNMGM
ncbi:PilW family protein [uncultured Desulfosarcina sp.]|uniref:PilW family protein n=1 Tax=uncultured Desulfosarcina sp. TaxID=218289 RepID=UPI00374A449C